MQILLLGRCHRGHGAEDPLQESSYGISGSSSTRGTMHDARMCLKGTQEDSGGENMWLQALRPIV